MLSPDCAVVIGLSGGADSVALLHVMCRLREEGVCADLMAVHINHGLRGAESDRDEQFVRALCAEWHIPLFVHRADIAAMAAQTGKGVEEVGREVRYAFFEQTAAQYATCRIATAHHADDSAETLLLHLCRGSGLRGATGIPAMRGKIIRPLISCSREEIETYCREHELSFVVDSTNTDETYARNRIRHAVMPQLRAINPQVTTALERFMEQARQADTFLETLTAEALKNACVASNAYDRDTLLSLPEPLRSRALYALAGTAETRHIQLLLHALEEGSGTVVIPTGKRLVVTPTRLKVGDNTPTYPFFSFSVTVGERYDIGEVSYRVQVLKRAEYEQKLNICKKLFQYAVDYDTIKGDLVLRRRKDGDTFRPAGRKCGKSLKKLFNETKTESRDTVALLCDEAGILLVTGVACDERARITDTTTSVLVVEKEENV